MGPTTDNPSECLPAKASVSQYIAFIHHEGRQYEKIHKTYNGYLHETQPINSAKTGFLWLHLKSQLNKIDNPTLLLTDGHSVPPILPLLAKLCIILDSHFTR